MTEAAGNNGNGNKRRIDRPVVVEGKYDKIKLASLFSAAVITTEGFGIFKNREKLEYLRRLASNGKGIILLTDSDGAGLVIRNYLRTCLGEGCRVTHLYIPQIGGREKRKEKPSAEGTLGVEGMEAELLRKLFAPYLTEEDSEDPSGEAETEPGGPEREGDKGSEKPLRQVSKTDLYSDGLCGGEGSAEKRKTLCRLLGIPDNLSSNALLEAINLLGGYDTYAELIRYC